MSYARQLRTERGVLARLDYDPLNLRGRIELVNLSRPATGPNSAVGDLLRYDQKVLVTNGHRFLGKTCLVRFDLEHKLKHHDVEILHGDDETIFGEDGEIYPLKGNFISTKIPFGFEKKIKEGVNPEDYILYGRLKSKPIPSFEDVNNSYNPGKMGLFAYIRGKGKGQEVYVISPDGIRLVTSYAGISELLPRPHRRSRVVLAESKKRIRELIYEIIKEGIVPIRMQPLHLN